jgi:RNA polymerase sigma-32 factor
MAISETDDLRRGADSYTRSAMAERLLEADEERMLAKRWREQGDERALHALTTAYLRLVVSIARRFRFYGLPISDLVQEGNVGLMMAAARFDPAREVRFSTYAAWWIRSSMQDFVLRNWSIVRTGTTAAQKALFFNLRRLRARIGDSAESLPHATRAVVARTLRVSERDVDAMAARLSGPDRSLNAPMSDDGEAEWQDFIAADGADPEAEVMAAHDCAARVRLVHDALQGLNERERLIIHARRLEEEAITLEALGERLGVSKERVRQIESAALEKLRRLVLARVGDPVAAGYVG